MQGYSEGVFSMVNAQQTAREKAEAGAAEAGNSLEDVEVRDFAVSQARLASHCSLWYVESLDKSVNAIVRLDMKVGLRGGYSAASVWHPGWHHSSCI
jgi:hypothetical protein